MSVSAPAAARPPRLVLRFAIYCAIALALAWLAIFWVVRSTERSRALSSAENVAVQLTGRTAPLLEPADLARPVSASRRRELDRLFQYELAGDVLRIKLWSPDGVVTYSNDPSLIGDRIDEPAELAATLRGETVQEVAGLNDEGGSGEDVPALESWVPVYLENDSTPAAALEIFQDYGPVEAGVRQTVTPVALALALTLLLLYTALLPMLRQVTKTLDSRHRRLADHAAALGSALEQRRQAEARLGQAERNYRNLVEQLPLVTYIDRLDETSSSIYMSPQVEGMLGYTALEWMSDPEFFVKVLHPEDRDRILALHRSAYDRGDSFAAEYRMIARDGRIVTVQDEIMIARDAEGRPLHAQGFLVDVTEQKRAEAERERSLAELAALHETALLLVDELDVQKLLARIAGRAGELVGTADTYVYLKDSDDELRVAIGTGAFAGNVGRRMPRGEGLAGRVWETGEPLAVNDYLSWPGRHLSYEGAPFHAVAGVPLRSRSEIVGVLGVAYLEEGREFTPSEIELLSRFAHLVSLALASARLYAAAREELAERSRVEGALREAELRYRSLVENLPLATYISPADLSLQTMYVSPQVETLLGYSVEEWMNQPELVHEAVHPDDLERVLADAERLRETGEPIHSEYRYRTADGRTIWVLDETILVRDDEGTPLWVQGFIFDITERKAAEDTRARLAAIVESSDDAIMSTTRDLLFTSWNAGAERMFGYTAEEVLGESIAVLLPPDREEETLSLARRVVEESEVVRLETVRLREDGAPLTIAFTFSPIRDQAGEVAGVSAIGQDVTERKRAEAAIRESEAKFRSFVETTEEWVWAMDADGTHTYSNPAIERLLGWNADDLLGRNWLDFILDEDREVIERQTAEHALLRTGWSGVVMRWRARDGGIRYLESTATPVLDDTGELAGWRGTDRDVTHRIQAEADRERLLAAEQEARAAAEEAQRDLAAQNDRLRELDRLKDEFIALVSHELRTPLTSIRGYTELLLDGEAGSLTDDQRQFLAVVERNSHRLLHLVGDLLFLAQVEAGKLVLDVGALDLGSVASESVEAARPQAEAKGVTLTLATGPVPLITGDRARIGQLLDNLVSNAIKFTPEGGRADIRVRGGAEQAIVEVRDSGIGIPADEQPYLFQRFYRTTTATEQAIQGTGLGLAISKAIVEAHDGRIAVESEEGVGTTFRVTLPIVRPARVEESRQVAL